MQKIFTVVFLAFLVLNLYPQNNEDNYKISCPSYIPLNSSFDISLITSNRFTKADTLEFYVLPGEDLTLKSIDLNTSLWMSALDFKPASLEGYSGPVYKSFIDLSDSAFTPGSFFQLIIRFRNENISKSIVNVFGVYKKKGKILGYLNSKIKNKHIKESEYVTIPVSFYSIQKVAGKALLFSENTSFNISLNESSSENLLTEFWIKTDNPEEDILTIKNKVIPEFQFSLSTSSFQILSVDSKSGSQIFSSPHFISLKSWYHISILFSFKNYNAAFYCNGSLIARYKLNSLIEAKDLIFSFSNSDEKKLFELDLLRMIDLHNSITYSFNNRNFLSFTADSSTVLTQLKIDKPDALLSLKNVLDIELSGIQLVKSDAPIFAKAPELNIKMLSNSYELEWNGGDFKQAQYYVLEKSLKNSDYLSVYRIDADNSTEKNYSFLDQKEESSDIIYYRIKQVDKDGSVVYSSQVKIGQGFFEPFVVEQNYPNPFNPKTSIVVELLEDSDLKVIIYNLEGKEIERLHDGFLEKGVHKFKFDATDLPSGVYLYKVETPEFSQTKKMILTK